MYPDESDRDAIARLAVQFLGLARPRARARAALIGLARADWDIERALDRWPPVDGEGVETEIEDEEESQGDEGEPAMKRRRLNATDEDEYDEGEGKEAGDGGGKGKEKGKERTADD